jgi:hypothetical protein
MNELNLIAMILVLHKQRNISGWIGIANEGEFPPESGADYKPIPTKYQHH